MKNFLVFALLAMIAYSIFDKTQEEEPPVQASYPNPPQAPFHDSSPLYYWDEDDLSKRYLAAQM